MSTDGMQGVSDDMTTQSYTPTQAAASLARIEFFHEGLRRRTEGTLWMVWGLVFAAIFVSFHSVAHDAGLDPGETPTPLRAAFLVFAPWVGWIAAGAAISASIWRSAALQDESVSARSRALRTLLVMVSVMVSALGFVLLSWVAEDKFGLRTGNFVNPLLVLGTLSLAIGVFDPLRLSAMGRNVARATGLVQIVAGLMAGVLLPVGPYPIAAVWMGVACGASWVAGGIYETLRG